MNPYNYILAESYGDPTSKFGLASAAVLVLEIMAAGYGGEMPSGSNPYKWVLEQLAQYGQHDFYRHLAIQWSSLTR